MPLLMKASENGEDARVLSILAAGTGAPLDEDDLGLNETSKASLFAASKQCVTYNDLLVQASSIAIFNSHHS